MISKYKIIASYTKEGKLFKTFNDIKEAINYFDPNKKYSSAYSIITNSIRRGNKSFGYYFKSYDDKKHILKNIEINIHKYSRVTYIGKKKFEMFIALKNYNIYNSQGAFLSDIHSLQDIDSIYFYKKFKINDFSKKDFIYLNKKFICKDNVKILSEERMYEIKVGGKKRAIHIAQYDENKQLMHIYPSITYIANKFGYSKGKISDVINGKLSQYKGFTFKQI